MNISALMAALNGDIDNAVAASTPGGIEAQEAAGQKRFVANETLPIDCPKDDLEKHGFVFGEPVDDLFISVKFPDGWKKIPTDHSVWSDLVDQKGRKRGGVFYKAAFYDQKAEMHLLPRFSVQTNYEFEDGVEILVFDCDTVIHRTEKVICKRYSDDYWVAETEQNNKALQFLKAKYPEWRDVNAYWD